MARSAAPYDLSSIALRATDDEKMKIKVYPFVIGSVLNID